MGQREGQVLGEELLDVGALDIVGLLELDNAEDLEVNVVSFSPVIILASPGPAASFDRAVLRTWMDRKRAR